MNSRVLRKTFQQYFTQRGHRLQPSSLLLAQNDPSLLFVNAGMNQFKSFFLGEASPPAPALFSIQKCLRAGGKHNDLEQVGCSLFHHTFFEMMGYFSFGKYFKEEAIRYAFEFLTQILKIPQKNLWVSVFKDDLKTAQIWKKQHHLPDEKIFVAGAQDNFWRMGDSGPCGPCSEIYYYNGPKKNPQQIDMTEIWNLVFMEFNEDQHHRLSPLPAPCIDTGMGLERITAVLQGTKDNYQTDLFAPIISSLETAAKTSYQKAAPAPKTAFRVTADHARAIAFLISDGLQPGNTRGPYVLRRILRRGFFYSQKLNPQAQLLRTACLQVIEHMSDIYPQLLKHKDLILLTLEKEHTLFYKSLEIGQAVFAQKTKMYAQGQTLDPALVWDLYSTYGFPPDLTRLAAVEKGLSSPSLSLEQLKKQFDPSFAHKKSLTSKTGFKARRGLAGLKTLTLQQKTKFTGYKTHQDTGQVLLILDEQSLSPLSHLKTQQTGWIVLNQTCFYPESGGAVGDTGFLKAKNINAQVLDTQKKEGIIFHKIYMQKGELAAGDTAAGEVDLKRRQLIAASHSATHLLHWSLRDTLGEQVQQKGSLVEPGRLRFDFSFARGLTKTEWEQVENKVQSEILTASQTLYTISSYEQAKAKGALSLAGEKYETQVRTVQIGKSLELCGGIHAADTSQIGGFKILSENGVQAGVRRITACTSQVFKDLTNLMENQNKKLREYLNIPLLSSPEKQNPFICRLKTKELEIKTLKKQIQRGIAPNLKGIALASKGAAPNSKSKEAPNLKTQAAGADHQAGHKPPAGSQPLFLVQQNEELRTYLKLPGPKDLNEGSDFFIPFIQKKQKEAAQLKKQLSHLSLSPQAEDEIKQASSFLYQNKKAFLLFVRRPISDRKILIQIGDSLKAQLKGPGIVLLLGTGSTHHPFVVLVSKELQTAYPAEKIFKTATHLLGGRGGGRANRAGGVIDKPHLFSQLKAVLLKQCKSK